MKGGLPFDVNDIVVLAAGLRTNQTDPATRREIVPFLWLPAGSCSLRAVSVRVSGEETEAILGRQSRMAGAENGREGVAVLDQTEIVKYSVLFC